MANLVIGIEGLIGAGKTSICRELVKKYLIQFLLMVEIFIELLLE